MAAVSPNTSNIPTWSLGERLRKARETAGVSIDEMASVLEVSDRTIRNYEADSTPIKRPSIRSWSVRCGVPMDWIITGEAPKDGTGGGGEPSTSWYSRTARSQPRQPLQVAA